MFNNVNIYLMKHQKYSKKDVVLLFLKQNFIQPINMKEKSINNKLEYLKENFPFSEIPKLSDEKLCIHCDSKIKVGDFKVFIDQHGEEFICCPNAPECDGTLIDWFDI